MSGSPDGQSRHPSPKAKDHGADSAFIDLPSRSQFLIIQNREIQRRY
jgi:hypothetical protein